MKRIPIKEARNLGKRLGMDKAILILEEASGRTHVVTWGERLLHCVEAARFGNEIKRKLGWPEELCHAKPARQLRAERTANAALTGAESVPSNGVVGQRNDCATCTRRNCNEVYHADGSCRPNAPHQARAVADSVQADVRCDHSSHLCTDCNHRHPHAICTLETTPRARPPCDQNATCGRTGLVVRCTPNNVLTVSGERKGTDAKH